MIYDHPRILPANRNQPGMVSTPNGGNAKVVGY